MFKGYIYRHWIILEDGVEKSYIGQTIRKPSKRWKNGNGYTGYDSDTHFARAINKYGWDKFNHEIIGIVESETKEQVTLDLNEWLPKDLAGIKRKYEEEADRINTVGPSGKKNYNILAWGNIKDELFGMMLREGYDLVDDNGNLNRNGLRTLSDKEKLDQIIAIELGDKAM